jgi:hypothetical protein
VFCGDASIAYYWKHVATTIGVPGDCNPEAMEWVKVLVQAVAKEYQYSFLEKAAHAVADYISSCTDPPSPYHEENNAVAVHNPDRSPILIFDNFDSQDEIDFRFAKQISRVAMAQNVLVFFLTEDRTAANRIIQQNAWKKTLAVHSSYMMKTVDSLVEGPAFGFACNRVSRPFCR